MKTHKIYEIHFSDGALYIGRTSQKVEARIAAHRHKPCNRELARRLREGMDYEAKVTCEYEKLEHAETAEEARIKMRVKHPEGKTLLNRWFTPNLPPGCRMDYNESRTHAICTWCRRKLPAAEMGPDRSRSSGIASRCIRCKTKAQALWLHNKFRAKADKLTWSECRKIATAMTLEQEPDIGRPWTDYTGMFWRRQAESCQLCGSADMGARDLCERCYRRLDWRIKAGHHPGWESAIEADRAGFSLRRREPAPCLLCGVPAVAKGLCRRHYQRVKHRARLEGAAWDAALESVRRTPRLKPGRRKSDEVRS